MRSTLAPTTLSETSRAAKASARSLFGSRGLLSTDSSARASAAAAIASGACSGAQGAPDRGQNLRAGAHASGFLFWARYCSKKVCAAGFGKSRWRVQPPAKGRLAIHPPLAKRRIARIARRVPKR